MKLICDSCKEITSARRRCIYCGKYVCDACAYTDDYFLIPISQMKIFCSNCIDKHEQTKDKRKDGYAQAKP